jgi:hypothetical protein
MPLKKGKSKKTISSFFKTMSDMFPMFERMAIWTKNLKIIKTVVFPISIFVVNAQYLGNSIISTSFACPNHTSQSHIFSDRSKSGIPHFLFRIIDTFHSTINAMFRGVCKKFFSTMLAIAGYRPFKALRSIITLFATIFCSIRARRNVQKLFPTSFAISNNLHTTCQSSACSRAILKTIYSVLRNINKSFTITTTHVFTSKGV